MKLLLLALGVYCGGIAIVAMISRAYASGGILGVIAMFAAFFGGAFLAKKMHEDDKKKK